VTQGNPGTCSSTHSSRRTAQYGVVYVKDTSAPQSPDPAVSIPLQGEENRKTFDYQLGQMRTGTSGPTGTTGWTKTPTFDQAGYDKALQAWQSQAAAAGSGGSAGTPATPAGGYWETQDRGSGSESVWVPTPGTPAVPGTAGLPGALSGEPDRNAFTNYDWTQTTTLSPEQQALYDTNVKNQQGQADVSGMLTNQIQSGLANPLDFSGLTDSAGFAQGLADRSLGDNFNNTMSDAAYRQQTRYLDPQMDQQRQALQANLADQGFVPGTPGYDRAMQNFMDTSNRAYGSARDSAIGQGYSQGNTQLQIQNQIAQLLSGQRSQGLSELLTQRNQPLNELAALRGGTGVQMPSTAGTSATPNLGATDILGQLQGQYQGQLGQYGADVSSNNATMGSLSSLAMAAAMFF